MTGIIHKYLRRAIVWAQTPSAEEAEAHAQFMFEQRRKDIAKLVPKAILNGCYYSKWIGLSLLEKQNLTSDIARYAEQNDIPRPRAAMLERLVWNDGHPNRSAA